MKLCLSGLFFLLVISLASVNGLFGNDGVELRVCTTLGGRCFFGCKMGWAWVAYCHNVLSCCIEMKKNKPPAALLP
ncbi:defensin beta 136 [Diceros bicornis minor]|uniref:defensin beta 136 n=1 Tax=Diceros bicornis minor TaxID=77932 RepID=UPI0026ED2AD1|nr:defensin beta 136 [Diceros bicornis minor]